MRLLIVLVNYNGSDLTIDCLESLALVSRPFLDGRVVERAEVVALHRTLDDVDGDVAERNRELRAALG